MKSALYLIIIVAFTIASCSGPGTKVEKDKLIPEKDLIPILIDIHITDGLLALPKINYDYVVLDSITTYYHVIEKHGYTKEMMDNTMKYYFIINPKKLNKIYDIVLGRLSEMESRIEKQAFIEQNKKSNLWPGKEFYAVPYTGIEDAPLFNITLTNQGFYRLAYTATVYPDDQSYHPQLTIYSVSPDSLTTGKKHFIKSIRYLKDGNPHTYFVKLNVKENTIVHFSGSLFDSANPDNYYSHYKIENISLIYSILNL